MYRHEMKDLERWHGRARRKPLVIRGARQVGKTTLVRLFAERFFEQLAEINFEREPQMASLFSSLAQGAEADERKFKALFLDVGLMATA